MKGNNNMTTVISAINTSTLLNQNSQQQPKQLNKHATSYYHALVSETSTFEDRVGPPDEITLRVGPHPCRF
jgi:hypothetical protein